MSGIDELLHQAINMKYLDLEAAIKLWREKKPNGRFEYKALMREFEQKFITGIAEFGDASISTKTVMEFYLTSSLKTYTGSAYDICLLVGYKNLFDEMYRDLLEQTPLSVDMLLHYHGILMAGNYHGSTWDNGERPGTLKKNVYPPGHDIEWELEHNIMQLYEYSDRGTDMIIENIARFYLWFIRSDTFADGNEVLASMLLNYNLMYWDMPPMLFRKEYKEQFEAAIKDYDETGSAKPFANYMRTQMRFIEW